MKLIYCSVCVDDLIMTERLFSACNSTVQDWFLLYKIMSSQILCSDLEFVLRYLTFSSVKERNMYILYIYIHTYITKANGLIYILRWNMEIKFEYTPTITAILDQMLSCNDNQDEEG